MGRFGPIPLPQMFRILRVVLVLSTLASAIAPSFLQKVDAFRFFFGGGRACCHLDILPSSLLFLPRVEGVKGLGRI